MSKSKSSKSKSSRKLAILAIAPAVMFSVALIIMATVVVNAGAADSPFAQEFKSAVTGLVIVGMIMSFLLFGGLSFLATKLASSVSKRTGAGRSDDDPGDNYRHYIEGEYSHLILH